MEDLYQLLEKLKISKNKPQVIEMKVYLKLILNFVPVKVNLSLLLQLFQFLHFICWRLSSCSSYTHQILCEMPVS